MRTKTFFAVVCTAVIFGAIHFPAEKAFAQTPVSAATMPAAGPTVQITIEDGSSVDLKIFGKTARRVLLLQGHTASIRLHYDASYAGLALAAAPMDGGTVAFGPNGNTVGPNGMVALQFTGGQLPGLYRVAVNCGGMASTLQFWMPDPGGSVDASIAVPQPSPSPTAQ
jgi:hypothetical protein